MICSDHSSRTYLVFDDDRLANPFPKAFTNFSGEDIGCRGGAATTNLIGPFVNAYSRADTLKEVMHAEAIRKFLLFIWNAPDKGA
jgi:hypothetical protein